MQLRKLNRRVLRAGFRCPCVFELVDSGTKKTEEVDPLLVYIYGRGKGFSGLGVGVGHCRRRLG